MATLEEIRMLKNSTQQQACSMFGISLHSYITYENDDAKVNTMNSRYMVNFLNNYIAFNLEACKCQKRKALPNFIEQTLDIPSQKTKTMRL